MLELLADAGPGSLGLWAIVIYAASMYPLGFLFGGCCGRCTRCNHFYNGTGCRAVQSIEFTVPGFGTASATGNEINDNAGADCLFDVEPELSLGAWAPDCLAENPPGLTEFNVRAEIRFDTVPDERDCNCSRSFLDASVWFYFNVLDSESIVKFSLVTEDAADLQLICEGKTVTLSPEFYGFDGNFLGECEAEVLEWIESLGVTAQYTRVECDCGACCDNDGCEDDVAEGACDNWAGVGTSCDDDPGPCE